MRGFAISGVLSKARYWIRFTHYYCPLCGRERVYRERVHDSDKPTDWGERHIVIEAWDHCDA